MGYGTRALVPPERSWSRIWEELGKQLLRSMAYLALVFGFLHGYFSSSLSYFLIFSFCFLSYFISLLCLLSLLSSILFSFMAYLGAVEVYFSSSSSSSSVFFKVTFSPLSSPSILVFIFFILMPLLFGLWRGVQDHGWHDIGIFTKTSSSIARRSTLAHNMFIARNRTPQRNTTRE